jgi:hypothetical protein
VNNRLVFSTEARRALVSKGTSDRTSITSTEIPSSCWSRSAASSVRGTMSASAATVASVPSRMIDASPSRATTSNSGTSPLVANRDLCSKKDHRVGIAHRLCHQSHNVSGQPSSLRPVLMPIVQPHLTECPVKADSESQVG